MTRQEAWNGMNWIRQEKRLAIYLRDNLSCGWCGATVEDGAQLTLDHLRPAARGGSNDATNLICACKVCNDARRHSGQKEFAMRLTGGFEDEANEILRRVRGNARRSLKPYLAEAKAIVAQRGSAAAAITHLAK